MQVPPSADRLRHMGSNQITATVYDNAPIYSDALALPDTRATPPKQDFLAAAYYHDYVKRDMPGAWGENRWRQVEHYRSVPYIAIQKIMGLVGGASYQIMRRNRRPKGRTSFGTNGTVAKSTPEPQQQGRDEEYTPFDDYDHPIARLVRRPNPNESIGEFVAKVVLQNRLTGVGPVWAVPNNSGKPVELWSLRTPFMYPLYQQSQLYPNGAWRVNPYRAPGWFGSLPLGMGSAGAILPAEDVKRFLDPHPIIDWDGWSPLTAGAVQLDVFDSVEVSRKSAMDRGLNLDVLAIVPGLDDGGANRFAQQVEARHMGAEKAKRFMVLAPPPGSDSKPTVTTITSSPREMDYTSGWEQTLKFVLALFGVPAEVAGIGDSASTYATWYAARQQFYDVQEDYLNRIAVWFAREFLSPWESYPDEFLLRIKPRPIDDREMAEKKHSRQLQYDTISYNESRAKDDLPPKDGGDVPVSVYVAQQQQALAPPPDAGMGGEPSAPLQNVPDGGDDDGSDVPDEMAAAALEELGVPGEETVAKARREGEVWQTNGRWFTLKNGRTVPAKGPSAGGGGKKLTQAQYDRHAERLKGGENMVVLDHPKGYQTKIRSGNDLREFHESGGEIPTGKPGAKPAASRPTPPPIPSRGGAQQQQPAQASPRVSQVSQRAQASPAVKEQLARAHEWADQMAEQHADRVAKHLGIDRASAKHVLASTIKMLAERALRGESDTSKKYAGASGKKLTIGVNKKPGVGAPPGASPPRPKNAAGEGSLAPRAKSMSSMVGSAGGFLVPAGGRMRKRKKRGLRGFLKSTLKALEG